MRMKFDYTESARPLAPEGEYQLRLATGEKDHKVFGPSSKGKPMLSLKWYPFNPPDGVSMSDLDKVVIMDWISLAPNALFAVKRIAAGCGQEISCQSCNTSYNPNLDACPNCQSMLFEIDWDFLDTCQPGAFIKITKDQKGEKDVNKVDRYFVWTKN